MYEHHVIGAQGEDAVAAYLEKNGYAICARNLTGPAGEIDIIATKGEVLAFVEVKARSAVYFNLSEVVVPSKQRKIIKTARRYSALRQIHDKVYRFDVALVERKENAWHVTYIPNAFTDEWSPL